jgi:hypothetical protein
LYKETKTIKETQGMRAGPSQGMVARKLWTAGTLQGLSKDHVT